MHNKIIKQQIDPKVKICNHCNPKVYLNFNFSYLSYESEISNEKDILKFYERMKYCCSEPYMALRYKHSADKKTFFETIPIEKINWKHKKSIPSKFREQFPVETNEKLDILRVYPAGTPAGTANPRVIGMIKDYIYYIFYMDWKGELYNHKS